MYLLFLHLFAWMILFNISGYALHFVVFLRFSTLKTVVVTFYKNLIIPCSSQLRMFLSRLVTAHPLFYLNRRHPYIHLFILYVSTCIYFIFHNLSIEESHILEYQWNHIFNSQGKGMQTTYWLEDFANLDEDSLLTMRFQE